MGHSVAEYRDINNENNPVHFEFIGVMHLLELGLECEADEVWYEITERLLPSERSEKLIPAESDLCAIRNERNRGGRIR